MAVVIAFATTPGSACHVPNPIEGILAPVFNSKNWINLPIFSLNNNNKHKLVEKYPNAANGWFDYGLSWMQCMCIYGRKHEDEAVLPWFGGLDSEQLPFLPI